MRLRTLSALVLMTASASASAVDAIPLLSAITGPSIPGLGALPLGALPAGLLGAPGGLPALPGIGSLGGFGAAGLRLPALPAFALPGLIPLPALPIPVTQMTLNLGGYDMLFGTLEGLAPVASQLPVPAVATMFSNYNH